MSTQVFNLEKEYILRLAKEKNVDIHLTIKSNNFIVNLLDVSSNSLSVKHNVPLEAQQRNEEFEFRFSVQDKDIVFKTQILEPGNKIFKCKMPEFIFSDLSKRLPRLAPPSEMQISFSFEGEKYDLDFPVVKKTFANEDFELSKNFNVNDLKNLVLKFNQKASLVASEKNIVMFRNKKPNTTIEKIISDTGKVFFLPSAFSGVPLSDPFLQKTILTKNDIISWFSENNSSELSEELLAKFESQLNTNGIISEIYVPILFQSFTVGYCYLCNKDKQKQVFNLNLVEEIKAFAEVLSWSLKENGYWKNSPKLVKNFRTQIINISASGIMFACRDQKLNNNLHKGTKVSISIKTKTRVVNTHGIIMHQYNETSECVYGIQFDLMAPEDFRYLYEYLYHKTFSDTESNSIEGRRLIN